MNVLTWMFYGDTDITFPHAMSLRTTCKLPCQNGEHLPGIISQPDSGALRDEVHYIRLKWQYKKKQEQKHNASRPIRCHQKLKSAISSNHNRKRLFRTIAFATNFSGDPNLTSIISDKYSLQIYVRLPQPPSE